MSFQMVARLHNTGHVHVTGSAVSIDMLRELLIPNRLVQSLSIYEGEGHGPHVKVVEHINYTRLKEMREELL